jgi:hypothetical protein
MTLLITEFHVTQDLQKATIVFAADRRLTMSTGRPEFRKKIAQIPHLKAGIGYAGIAQTRSGDFLSSWLANFISHSADCTTLGDFGDKLIQALSNAMPKAQLAAKPSIFHLAGRNPKGYPELWHIRNCEMIGNAYANCQPQYIKSENFLREDARIGFGFDGSNATLQHAGVQFYVNGDVVPFHAAWKKLDQVAATMYLNNNFEVPADRNAYKQHILWKMGVIADFNKMFAKNPFIGKPIDCFILP